MPNIVEKYDFVGLSSDCLYKECLNVLQEMGVVDIQESNLAEDASIKTIAGVAPNMWGWGGMKIGMKVYQTNTTTSVELNGFIAQLGVSPLTGKMDDFLKRLRDKLATQYNYDFQYEKLTRFLPKYKLHFSKIDLIALLLILVITFFSTFTNVFGGISEAILIGPVLGIGYYLGKKYLFSGKTTEEKK